MTRDSYNKEKYVFSEESLLGIDTSKTYDIEIMYDGISIGSITDKVIDTEWGQVVPVSEVRLNKDMLNLVVGDSEQLIATVTPDNSTNKNVIWTSSDDRVATVDNTGKVTAVAPGMATITVTTVDKGLTDTCMVSVVGGSNGGGGGGIDYVITTTFSTDNLYSNTMFTAYINVKNINAGNEPVLAIVALHDERNMLVNLSYISKVIKSGETETLHAGFKLPANVTGHRVKAFVWDGENLKTTKMKPLSNVVSLSAS